MKRILDTARSGLPLKFAAKAGGIDYDTLAQWRIKYPEFGRELEAARTEAVREKWKKIEKAAEDRLDKDGALLKAGDWRALAWQLERAWPRDFARPDVVLNSSTTMNVQNNFTISVQESEEIATGLTVVDAELMEGFRSRELPDKANGESGDNASCG